MIIKYLQKAYKASFSVILKQVFSGGCRFYPTCSDYSYQAIEKYGIIKGIFISIKRLVKCNPFNISDYYQPLK